VTRTDAGTGRTVRVAGNGTYAFCGDGGAATSACLSPYGLAIDGKGNLLVLDASKRVREVDATSGAIRTIAGNGFGYCDASDDPIDPCNACLAFTGAIAADPTGAVLLADEFYSDDDLPHGRVRMIDAASGTMTTVAGRCLDRRRPVVDGDSAVQACLDAELLAVDGAGNLYLADRSRVLEVDRTTGALSLIADSPNWDCPPGGGDGGPATLACLGILRLAVDRTGNVYLGELQRVRRIDRTTGIITTIAGGGTERSCTTDQRVRDGMPATAGCLKVDALAVDDAGNVYVTDFGSVRRIDAHSGLIDTVAGPTDPTCCIFRCDPPSPEPCLDAYWLAVDPEGRIVAALTDRIVRITMGPSTAVSQVPEESTDPSVGSCTAPSDRECVIDADCTDRDRCAYDLCWGDRCQHFSVGGYRGAACTLRELGRRGACARTTYRGHRLARRIERARVLVRTIRARGARGLPISEGLRRMAQHDAARLLADSERLATSGKVNADCWGTLVERARRLVAILDDLYD
jgi:hypothetical protein